MSASLVGSEMCIRDSSWRAPGDLRRAPGRAAQGAAESAAQSCGTRCSEPVSYTHLTLPTICSV
eukprot:3955995-Alexandrium_andersonii.AAC.1